MLVDIVKKGSVDRSVPLRIIDLTDGSPENGVAYNTSGIALWYRREGGAVVDITEADLAALTTAHTDGGVKYVRDAVYRLDLPDAAFATGANHVDYGGTITGMIVIGGRVRLTDIDLEDTVRMGLTALPNVVAGGNGGLPVVDATGAVKIQSTLRKNQAVAVFYFKMTDSTNHNPLPSLTDIVATRSLDGGSYGGGTLGAINAVSGGIYWLAIPAADLNGNAFAIRFTSISGADQVDLSFILVP